MSISVGELKEFLKDVPEDKEIDFCIGDSFVYPINKVYVDANGMVWLDSEE